MAREVKQVTVREQRSIVSRYNKGIGLVAIAKEFEHSINIIRRVLADNSITIRGRGRPAAAAAAAVA